MAERFIDWPADPWAGAGYSFLLPGQVTTLGPLLYTGLGRLHFPANIQRINLLVIWKERLLQGFRWLSA